MRKVKIYLLVAVVCGLVSARNMQAAEKAKDLKREVIQLCEINADLADQLNRKRDEEAAGKYFGLGIYMANFFLDENGRVIEKIPTSTFFSMVADFARRDTVIAPEVKEDLERYNAMFEEAKKKGKK